MDITYFSEEAVDLAMKHVSPKQKIFLIAKAEGEYSHQELADRFSNQEAILLEIRELTVCLRNIFGDKFTNKRRQFEVWVENNLPKISRARVNMLWLRAHEGFDALILEVGRILHEEADGYEESRVGLDLWRARKILHLSITATTLSKTENSITLREFNVAKRIINGHGIARIARAFNTSADEIAFNLNSVNDKSLFVTNARLFNHGAIPQKGGGK